MPTLSRKILKSFSQIFSGEGIRFICSVASGYFFALFLGPSSYGIWQTASVFLSYGTFTSLGIPFVMRRDFITLRAEGRIKDAEKLAHVSITFGFIVQPIVALVFIIISLVSKSEFAFRMSILLVGLLYLSQIVSSTGQILHRGFNDYKTVGIGGIIYGIGTLFIVPLVYFYGFYALLISYFILSIINSIYFYRKRPISYKWVWDFPVLKKMIFSGFPLFLVSLISILFTSVDRLLIAGLIDFKNVGLYSLSTFLAQPITLLLSSFSIVIFTQLNERYGASKEPHVIEKHTYIPQKLFSHILPPVIGFAIIALPTLTNVLLPQYTGGIAAAQINIFAILFLKLAGFSSSGLFVLDKQKFTAISFFIAGSLKTIGSYLALKAGYGIESVALFSLIAYFIYNSMMLYHINRSLGNGIKIFLNRLHESLICPVTVLIFCMIYLHYQENVYFSMGVSNLWIQMIIGLVMITLVSSGFLWNAYKMVKKLLV
jgi:O-antigen/teichoic acid export membrane protein